MTREEWLRSAVDKILEKFGDIFDEYFGTAGTEHLDKLYVSAGFPSVQGLTKRIGECWKAETTEGGYHHIFINPRLEDIVEVIATLAHEMVHAADNGEHSHKGPFVKAVRAMGLEGKPTATYAGEEFAEWAKGLEKTLGAYPHQRLRPVMKEKKQTNRQLKVEAKGCCGYVARTTRKWIDECGTPLCPHGNEMEEA